MTTDGVWRLGASGSMVRGESSRSVAELQAYVVLLDRFFYLRNTCLVINVVPVTVVSFDRHTGNTVMTPPFEALCEARCFTIGESLDFVQVMGWF